MVVIVAALGTFDYSGYRSLKEMRAELRSLEREVSKICRKVVKSLVMRARNSKIIVNAKNLDKYLGVRRFSFGVAEK